jgi:hypothetical protein
MGPLHPIFVSEGVASSGVPRAVKRVGGWGRTHSPCGLPRLFSGGRFAELRILRAGRSRWHEAFRREVVAGDPGGTRSQLSIRGHEPSALSCYPGWPGTRVSTRLRADPYQSGSVLAAFGTNAKSPLGW